MNEYIVYKITNNVNGKSYIGATKRSLDERWNEHLAAAKKNKDKIKFYYAISKYGQCSWIKEVLYITDNRKDMFDQEREFIKKFSTIKNGYNTSVGGEGGSHYFDTLSDDEKIVHNKKISFSRSGKASIPHHTENTKKLQSLGNKKFHQNNPGYSAKRRTYVCTNIGTGETFVTENLKMFCLIHDLSYGNMLYNCRNKFMSTAAGWSCRIKENK